MDLIGIYILLQAIFTVASVGLATTGGQSGGDVFAAVLIFVGSFAVIVGWPIAWETLTKGRSPGKMALGLRVVTLEGAPISFRHALIRGLVGTFEILFTFGIVAVTVALSSSRFRRLGDHLAGTVVLRERGTTGIDTVPHRFIPYPGWEGWVERLDVTRLSSEDYRLVRTYLLRAPRLPDDARQSLGADVLARVIGKTGLDEPSRDAVRRWAPEVPLVSVAAAYQRRWDGLVGI